MALKIIKIPDPVYLADLFLVIGSKLKSAVKKVFTKDNVILVVSLNVVLVNERGYAIDEAMCRFDKTI